MLEFVHGKYIRQCRIKCDYCNRRTHLSCIKKTEDDVKEDAIHYFCIICEANTTKSQLKSLFTDVLETILEDCGQDYSK